jgi:hypothetical protein
MRFGITSISGLIVGLLAPFSAFLRTPTLTAIGASLLVSFLVFIYLTLDAMKGTPPPAYVPPPPTMQQQRSVTASPPVDPTMKKMLLEIYGPE